MWVLSELIELYLRSTPHLKYSQNTTIWRHHSWSGLENPLSESVRMSSTPAKWFATGGIQCCRAQDHNRKAPLHIPEEPTPPCLFNYHKQRYVRAWTGRPSREMTKSSEPTEWPWVPGDLYIYKHIHTHIYIYICIHIHKHIYIYTHIYINIYLYIYKHIRIYTYTYIWHSSGTSDLQFS